MRGIAKALLEIEKREAAEAARAEGRPVCKCGWPCDDAELEICSDCADAAFMKQMLRGDYGPEEQREAREVEGEHIMTEAGKGEVEGTLLANLSDAIDAELQKHGHEKPDDPRLCYCGTISPDEHEFAIHTAWAVAETALAELDYIALHTRALASEALIERIADALQTDERGDNLVAVAKAACTTEQELASAMGGEFTDIATRLANAEAERDRCREALEHVDNIASDFTIGDREAIRKIRPLVSNAIAFAPAPTQKDEGRDAWQPIETAPRDGSDFLALCEHRKKHHIIVGSFAPSGRFVSWPGRWAYEPTHWQPLPEPPALSPSDDAKGGGE